MHQSQNRVDFFSSYLQQKSRLTGIGFIVSNKSLREKAHNQGCKTMKKIWAFNVNQNQSLQNTCNILLEELVQYETKLIFELLTYYSANASLNTHRKRSGARLWYLMQSF